MAKSPRKTDLVSQTRAMTRGSKAKKRPDETPKVSLPKEGEDLHARALRHANEAWLQEFDNIDKGRDDQRFYAGEQWPADAAMARRDENRPVITINRLPGFVRQLTGDVRQNTPAIKVLPARGEASKEIAKIYNGLIRNIETESNAKQAYVKAVENAAVCGIGAWRVTTQYSSDDAFEQDIRIKRIVDPFSVLIDPMARQPDKSDARYCFVFEDIAKEEFATRYPDKAEDNMPTGIAGQMAVAWSDSDTIKIAEYWYRETRKRKLQLMSDDTVRYADEAEEPAADLPPDLASLQPTMVQERDVDAIQIRSLIMNGKEVLGGPYEWAGRYIPIVVVTGEEIYYDGRCVRRGMIRDAKDPQRVYNYTRTASIEAVAMQPKTPFLATPGEIKGYENDWDTAGSKNHSVLLYNRDPQSPNAKPDRVQPAVTSTGLDIQSQIANEDMKGVTGIYDASLGQRSNETSGRAILARQKEGDTGTFHFIDNLAVGIEYTGRILVDLIPKVMDSTRIVRTLEEDGSEDMVPINVPHPGRAVDDRGQEILLNDLSVGEYDVTVVTGPSYATKRVEAAESLTEFMRTVPQSGAVIADLVAKNMDWPGAEEIAKRLERTIPPNLKEDNPGPPPPNPKDIADARETMASANLKDAQASKTLLEADALATQLAAMPAQLQQLTQLVMSLAHGGSPSPQGGSPMLDITPQQGGPGQAPPPSGGPPMGAGGPPGEPPMIDLQPMEEPA